MALVTALERQSITSVGNVAMEKPLLGYSSVSQATPCGVQAQYTSTDTSTVSHPSRARYFNWSWRNKKTYQRTARDSSASRQINRIYNKREWALLSRKRDHTETDVHTASHFQPSNSFNVRFNVDQNQYRTEDLHAIETHTHVIPYHEPDTEKSKNNCRQIKVSSHEYCDLDKENSHVHAYLAEESFRRSLIDSFQGIFSSPKVLKLPCNLKCSERLGSILCLMGVLMIFVGSCFDRMARQFATTKFGITVDMLADTLKSPNWLEELLASSHWLVGAEASITFQPYTMKHEGKSVIFVLSEKSTSISVKDQGDSGIRLFREQRKFGTFDNFYDNVNAAHIIVLNIVTGVAYDKFGDSFLKDAMVSQFMSRINITDQVVVHKSLKNIIEEFDFPDYEQFFVPGYGYYVTTENCKQNIRNTIKFLFEYEPKSSLLYSEGVLAIQNYSHVDPESFKDFGSFIAASSDYTLPGLELAMEYDKHSSWMGIITSAYSTYNVDVPQYILDKVPFNLTSFPLKITHPHSHEVYNATSATWIYNKLNSINSTEDSITHNPPVVSLQLHNTLGVPVTATVNIDLKVQVPDEDDFGILKGQNVPYMKISINVSRLPDWLMEVLHIFCAFRLFFLIFIPLATPVCLVTGIVFLCKRRRLTKETKNESEEKYPLLKENPYGKYGSLNKTSLQC